MKFFEYYISRYWVNNLLNNWIVLVFDLLESGFLMNFCIEPTLNHSSLLANVVVSLSGNFIFNLSPCICVQVIQPLHLFFYGGLIELNLKLFDNIKPLDAIIEWSLKLFDAQSLLFTFSIDYSDGILQFLDQSHKIMDFNRTISWWRQIVLKLFGFFLMLSFSLWNIWRNVSVDPSPLKTSESIIIIFGEVRERAWWCCSYP